MTIKNLNKAANRIKKAIEKNERIILYGDADLDGVAAVIVLKEAIKNLFSCKKNDKKERKELVVYFPDREIEGYGLTKIALNYLKQFSPALLITLDCGISNFKEVKLAKKLGFEVIIIDHHEILNGLPEAEIIVNPKQKGDKYPFKGLATAGISFKLSEVLLGKKMGEGLRRNFLELVALATLADMMPKENENLEFINLGLESLENSWQPGLQALFSAEFLNHSLDLNQKVARVISLLNVRDVEKGLPASFRLLDSFSFTESKELVKKLFEKSKLRNQKKNEIIAELKKRIEGKEEGIIFEGSTDWDVTLLPAVASIICNKYQKPTFIFKILEKEAQGTVRSISSIDSVALMKKCKQYLLSYGGHPQASGFRIKNENLEKFKKCLIKNIEASSHSVTKKTNSSD